MLKIKKNKYIIQPRPYCVSSFQTIYGLGKSKSTRLSCFLLNHPNQIKFSKDFKELLSLEPMRNMGLFFPIDNKIRLFVSHQLKQKILIFCYQAFRLFQNLPTKVSELKQMRYCFSLNPYLSLNVIFLFIRIRNEYKRKELMYKNVLMN